MILTFSWWIEKTSTYQIKWDIFSSKKYVVHDINTEEGTIRVSISYHTYYNMIVISMRKHLNKNIWGQIYQLEIVSKLKAKESIYLSCVVNLLGIFYLLKIIIHSLAGITMFFNQNQCNNNLYSLSNKQIIHHLRKFVIRFNLPEISS